VDADDERYRPTAEQVAAFLEHAADGDRADPAAVDHLRTCAPCADTARRLRAEPPAGPDLELRLLQAFHAWRSGGGTTM